MIKEMKLLFLKNSVACMAFILSGVMSTALCTCSRLEPGENPPAAVNGILDARNWDFKKKGPVELNGSWEFYWNRLIQPSEFSGQPTAATAADYAQVPGIWKGMKLDGKKLPGKGCATYRLRVLLNTPEDDRMGIKFLNISTAFEAFINGNKIASAGRVGTNQGDSSPGYRPMIADCRPDTAMDIVIHVSNFDYPYGGIKQTITIGTLRSITTLREKNLAVEFLFFGALFIMACYYLVLFMLNMSDRSPLYFGILCMILSFWVILMNERFVAEIFPFMSWEFLYKIEYGSVYVTLPLGILFVHSLFPGETHSRLIKFFLGAGAIALGMIIFLPANIYAVTLPYYHAVICAGFCYAAYVMAMAVTRKREGSRIIIVSGIIFMIAGVNDILNIYYILNTGNYLHIALLFLLFSHGYLITHRFSHAVKVIEDLTERLAESTIEVEKKNIQLIDLNWNLEEKVEERTEELKSAMERLETSNRNLTNVCRNLETAQAIAKSDMDMAINVQLNFLPKGPPQSAEWDTAYYYKAMSGISGDFYDFYEIDGTFCGLSLFDVSGHGISSGLITTIARSIIHRHFRQNMDKQMDIILTLVNQDIQNEIKNNYYYLTGVILRLKGNSVEYVNAGHPNILLKSGGIVKPVLNKENESISGSILGIKSISVPFEVCTFDVKQGDYLLLYSDGLTDSFDENLGRFDVKQLINTFKSAPEETSELVSNHITSTFFEIRGSTLLSDDITLIVMKKK